VSAEVVEGWRIEDHPIGLADVVDNSKATVLIGVSGVPGVFTGDVLGRMARNTQRPIVMPLSNPTSHAEATPASVFESTQGRAIVATGSPFPPVTHGGVAHRIGQANNMFIFPGVGLGALAVGARKITDRMLLSAASALAAQVPRERSDHGQIYPDIRDVCEVSRAVAVAVAGQATAEGVADPGPDVEQIIDNWIWVPEYVPYRPA
jgi:malate dehydrogenase (oxaloacetate-decarboxylating)